MTPRERWTTAAETAAAALEEMIAAQVDLKKIGRAQKMKDCSEELVRICGQALYPTLTRMEELVRLGKSLPEGGDASE